MGKYFKNKVKKNKDDIIKKWILIAAGVTIAIIIIILLIKAGNKSPNKPAEVIELKESLSLEIHSDIPQKEHFFEKYENVEDGTITIEYNDLNTDKVGEYEVTIRNNKKQTSENIIVKVMDTIPPEITLKEVIIEEGQEYSAVDFVEICTDNSGDCFVEFNNQETDGYYNVPGTYEVLIKAIDNYKNETIKPGKITIEEKPPICEYGELILKDEDKDIPIAYTLVDDVNHCAVSDNKKLDNQIHELLEEKRIKDLSDIEPKVQNYCKGKKISCYVTSDINYIYIYSNDEKILEDNRGVVGVAIKTDIYISDTIGESSKRNESDLKISYYLKEDGSREYLINEYNIK